MQPRITLITLAVDDLERAVAFYRDGLGLATQGIVGQEFEYGRKELSAGRLKAAKGHFEAVMRLLYRDQTNPSYSEARDQLDKVVKTMNGEVSG